MAREGAPTLPAVLVRPAGRKPFEDRDDGELWYAAYRLADSKTSRAVIDYITRRADEDGVTWIDNRAWRNVANRLVRTGLMSRSHRGGAYALTERGREVWKRAQQL